MKTSDAKNRRTAMESPLSAGILLFLAIFVAFSGALRNDFVGYDDPDYVTGNYHVRAGLSELLWAFRSLEAGNWHPLTWLSHMLDCQLYDLNPAGHHLTSILLHACSTVLLFLFLRRSTGAYWLSLVTAAIFGLHPLRVESVAWVAERKDVLSAFFWMAALWTYANYAKSADDLPSGKGSLRRTWYLATLLLFALGTMSKPMVVTFPFALLLLDFWPLRRRLIIANPPQEAGGGQSKINWWLLLEKVPFVLLAIAAAATTLFAQANAGALMSDIPLAGRLANIPVSYVRYLLKIFWPVNLAVFYPRDVPGTPIVAAATAIVAAISLGAWMQRRARPWLLVGWLWFLGVLVPVIGVVQAGEQALADRYSYLPSIGIAVILVWGWDDLNRRWPGSRQFTCALAAITLALCAWFTVGQIHFWKSTTSLFEHAVQVTKNNYLAHNNLGVVLDHAGRSAEARVEFEIALRDRPDYAEAHNNLGLTLAKLGIEEQAVQHYEEAIRLRPNYADPHNNLGLMLERHGRQAEAIKEYAAATRLRAGYADAHYNLGIALAREHRLDEAIAEFSEVVRYRPDSAEAHNNMGVALTQKRDIAGAIREYSAALALNPNYTRAHYNLGVALAGQGRLDEAIGEFEQALRLDPNYSEAQKNLESLRNAKQPPPVSRP